MKSNFKSVIAVILISVVIAAAKFMFPQTYMISSDNYGYYLYLPAKFIYDDPALKGDWYKTMNEKYKNTPTYYQLMQSPKGGIIDRFSYGMALIWSPAFFTAHTFAKTFDYEADGFSRPYQWALILYGGLIAIIGLLFSRKILLHFFSDGVVAITLLLMYIGTNLFFFVTLGNDVPHVYLFTLYTLIIWFTIKWHEKLTLIYAVGLGVALGFTMAVRQSEIIAAIIPVFWGITNYETLIEKIRMVWKKKGHVILVLIIAGAILLPQFLYWRTFAGEYILNVYNDAGSTLKLTNPRFGYVLFSFRKGWVIYSPLILLSFAGLYFCWKRYRTFFWPVVIHLFVNLYLIASFTSLVSFGWRAFIQSYAVLLLPMACFMAYLVQRKLYAKIIFGLILLPFIALNIHQAWQTNMEVIDGSRMTREYYFRILGKKSATPEDRALLLVERSFSTFDTLKIDMHKKNILFNDYEEESFFHTDTSAPTPYSGRGSFKLNKEIPFAPGLKTKYTDISNDYYFYLEVSAFVYSMAEDISEKLYLVVSTSTPEHQHLKYRAFSFNDLNIKFEPNGWNKISYQYLTPELVSGEEMIRCYIWYDGSGEVWVDNFTIDLYTQD